MKQVAEYGGKSCGVMKAGACANLILVDGNPLADMADLRSLSEVMVPDGGSPSRIFQRRFENGRGITTCP